MEQTLQQYTTTFLDDEQNPLAEEALVHLLGVACDLTASYHKGAFRGPQAILEASWQIEYEVPLFEKSMGEILPIHHLGILDYSVPVAPAAIAETMEEMVAKVKALSLASLQQQKFLMLTGGDHSVPNGAFQALSECYSPQEITIIHIDAHLDLRTSLGEFHYSHGSIMRRARELGFPIIHLGIRDHLGEEEINYLATEDLYSQIFFCATQPTSFYQTFAPNSSRQYIYQGIFTPTQIQSILEKCNTPYFWISLDIDGIDPTDMPGTGTPLPYGLKLASLEEFLFQLIQQKKKIGQKLLGIDLTEVSPQMLGEGAYNVQKVISTQTEQNAALLLYKILFWNFLEKFQEKES